MRIILGVILAVVVSAADDKVKTVSGCMGKTVHLPCPCSHNLDEEFAWQMDEPQQIPVLKYTNKQFSFGDIYNGRVITFLIENSENCSVLLANISTDDQGKYRCSFYNKKRYMMEFVNVNVTACPRTQLLQVITSGPAGKTAGKPEPDGERHHYVKIISFILALAVCLVLWQRRKRLYSRV